MLQSLSTGQNNTDDHFSGPALFSQPRPLVQEAVPAPSFDTVEQPARDTDILEAVAAIRRERVALRVQGQLLKNLETAEEDLEQVRQSLLRVQADAAEALTALQNAGKTDVSATYDRVSDALHALEKETAEAAVIVDWHRETRRLYDHSKGETENV